jgi:hypothetical protein
MGQRRPGIAEQLKKSLDVNVVDYVGKQPTQLTQEELHTAVDSATDYYSWVFKKGKRNGVWQGTEGSR